MVNFPVVPQKKTPFYKSKGFWGSVIATVSPFIPGGAVIGPIIGGILAGVGRAKAEGPLDWGLPPTQPGPTPPLVRHDSE